MPSIRQLIERADRTVRWDQSFASTGAFIDGTTPEQELLVDLSDNDSSVRIGIHLVTNEEKLQAALSAYPGATVGAVVGHLVPTSGIATGSVFTFHSGSRFIVVEPGVSWPSAPSVAVVQLVEDLDRIIRSRDRR